MSNATLLKISLSGAYQEREEDTEGKFERYIRKLLRLRPTKTVAQRYQSMLNGVAVRAKTLEVIDEAALQSRLGVAIDAIN